MKRIAFLSLALSLLSPATFAADSTVSAMTAASALSGPELFYCVQGGADRKCTATQLQTFANVPGGSTTQVQFNNAGAFAGDAGFTWDNTNKAISALGGGTVTTSNPVINASQTWNAGAVTFTGLKFNVTDTASAAASILADLQIGGTSKFKVTKAGDVTATGTITGGFFSSTATNSEVTTNYYSSGLQLNGSAAAINFGPTVASATVDTALSRSAAGVLNLSTGTAITAKQIYTPTQTLTDGATITFNADAGAVATVTIAATGRTLTPSNLKAGGTYVIFVKQDATGSRTITTWTNFKWVGGTAPTLSTAANAVDIITGVSDGTSLFATAQLNFQ